MKFKGGEFSTGTMGNFQPELTVGTVGIILGFTADAFYPAFMRRPRPNEKPAPKWLGRTIFTVVGLWFILSGLSDLRHR